MERALDTTGTELSHELSFLMQKLLSIQTSEDLALKAFALRCQSKELCNEYIVWSAKKTI